MKIYFLLLALFAPYEVFANNSQEPKNTIACEVYNGNDTVKIPFVNSSKDDASYVLILDQHIFEVHVRQSTNNFEYNVSGPAGLYVTGEAVIPRDPSDHFRVRIENSSTQHEFSLICNANP